mmetsp:Transcript_28223/g.44022  ORF Transcript_28223/g.44022 Transcript_28223/m.44022 type:complete len:527 (-) Transcript_28223:177-1757(-)
MNRLLVLLGLLALCSSALAQWQGTDEDPCQPSGGGSGSDSDPYIFKVGVDFYSSTTGYFQYENCNGPVVKINADTTYMFLQDPDGAEGYGMENHGYPLGFGYYADASHEGKEQLSFLEKPPGSTAAVSEDCRSDEDCQTAEYYGGEDGDEELGDGDLGDLIADSNDQYAGVSDGETGSKSYKRQFTVWGMEYWKKNKYNVRVKILDPITTEFYYYSMSHTGMSGKIIVANSDGSARTTANGAGTSTLPTRPGRSSLDNTCGFAPASDWIKDDMGPSDLNGDFGITSKCTSRTTCGSDSQLTECLDNAHCYADRSMRVEHTGSNMITFMRQLIALDMERANMAKAMLKLHNSDVSDADSKLGSDKAFVKDMLYEMISKGTSHVTMMHEYIKDHDSEFNDDENVQNEDCQSDLGVNRLLWLLYGGIGFAIGLVATAICCCAYNAGGKKADNGVYQPPAQATIQKTEPAPPPPQQEQVYQPPMQPQAPPPPQQPIQPPMVGEVFGQPSNGYEMQYMQEADLNAPKAYAA